MRSKLELKQKISEFANKYRYLTNAECDNIRRQPVNFNDMLRLAYIDGILAGTERIIKDND